jgi:patatin-like phospholipase/acyl hydrolase
LYELKQYERFANNHLDNHQQYDQFNQHHHVRSYSNGSNYSQNILNYNNSYYKINNINNYNYIKTSKSPTTYRSTDDVDFDNKKWSTTNYRGSVDNNHKMEHSEDIRAVERSHLVKEREANGHNVTIHNFSGNNHTTVHVPSSTVIDDEEQEFQHPQPNQKKHSGNPFQQSHHLTQVSSAVREFCGVKNVKGWKTFLKI